MEERRRAPRSRTFWKGTVLYSGNLRSAECIVRNFSDTGARLDCGAVTDIPDHFELKIPQKNNATFPCRVVWRRGGDLGVAFKLEGAVDDAIARKLEALEGQNKVLMRKLRSDEPTY
jgi:hypothetical protein